ncbi:MotE family protein [Stappia sp.]|uniref:MotE family protein n=1 Tax=Stappia sp. TaxID=1870903 RepID=UPI003A98D5C7
MTSLRLFPTLLLAASALLGVKLLAFVLDGGHPTSIGMAMAQETGAAGAASADAGAPAATAGTPTPLDSAAGDMMQGDAGQVGADGEVLPQGLEVGSSIAERKVLESLSGRRRELDQREKQADLRQQLLKATEDRLQKKVDEMTALEQSIKSMRDEQEKKKNEELKGLIVMYEAMKPKDAARIFDRLDLEILLKVTRQMKPRKLADVMAKMSPDASERLTVALVTGHLPEEKTEAPMTQALPKIMGN